MGIATIALLGPMAINGDPSVLAPRDRIVLSALALKPSGVEHRAPGRRALGCDAATVLAQGRARLHPSAPANTGRRLDRDDAPWLPATIDGDGIDTQRFEHLLKRGHELLALGEAECAACTLGEAIGLWRGGAYPDLDGWEPGRIEAARLTQLRLEAQDSRVEAALRAGRHADLLAQAQAQAAVAEAPLRDQRWGLLALAQYRCGRQGEALATLRRARQLGGLRLCGRRSQPHPPGVDSSVR